MTYSKQNPPTPGELIEIEIVWLSKCCGGRLVGFYHHGDKDYIYLSDSPSGGRIEQVGWESGTIRHSNRTQEICIDP